MLGQVQLLVPLVLLLLEVLFLRDLVLDQDFYQMELLELSQAILQKEKYLMVI
jgi:hypothetical protein